MSEPTSTPLDSDRKQADAIYVALSGECVFIRIKGRGSFKTSPALKQYCASMIEKGRGQILMDMRECSGMDSTFMGVLAGLARRLPPDGAITMINLNRKTAEVMETVGLHKLVKSDRSGPMDEACRKQAAEITAVSSLSTDCDKLSTARTILAAHEDLVAADASNLPKFRNVLDVMRREVEHQSVVGGNNS